MSNMKPALTPKQRSLYLALARKLDRVPVRKFGMENWVFRIKEKPNRYTGNRLCVLDHSPSECGYAGCAIGWATTMPVFKIKKGLGLLNHAPRILEMLGAGAIHSAETVACRLFGSHRKVGPRRVAKDIRAYLKDGTLPPVDTLP